jgi:hypothetical protein
MGNGATAFLFNTSPVLKITLQLQRSTSPLFVTASAFQPRWQRPGQKDQGFVKHFTLQNYGVRLLLIQAPGARLQRLALEMIPRTR